MRRTRKEATQVWHNPEILRHAPHDRGAPGGSRPRHEKGHDHDANRAALEALFAPRRPKAPGDSEPQARGLKPTARIVPAPAAPTDDRALERERLLAKLLVAEGRPSVSKAVNDYLTAGFELPGEQEVLLQVLEHADEAVVRGALGALDLLLAAEVPRRRAVLESRLRRIEQFAEEHATQKQAEHLRRAVSGRPTAD
jgi:hypothetical protein